MKITQILWMLALFAVNLFVSACSDSTYIPPPPEDAKTLTVSVTDAPVDGVAKVIVQFAGIEIKHEDADEPSLIEFEAPVDVDLLLLQGKKRKAILFEQKLATGDYEYMRLIVNAEQGEFDSVVLLEDNTWQSIYIPDSDKIGLKLNQAFRINSNDNTHLTIEFDLRKSLDKDAAEDDYQLRPSLRIVGENQSGHISGFIDNSLLTDNGCVDVDAETTAGVYLYPRLEEGAIPQDIQRNTSDPYASAKVDFNADTGEYSYTIGWLPGGFAYSAALVCDVTIDTPSAIEVLDFIGEIKPVVVENDLTTDLDFLQEQ